MSALSRHNPPTERGMPEEDQDHHPRDRQENARMEVSPSLLNRIRVHRGKPDLDLSLCSIGPTLPVDIIKENHEETLNLTLSYNRIRYLPSNFASVMSCLQYLELSHNELKKLPDNFGQLEQLVYLDVSVNKLQKLPLSMGKLTRLHYLNIHENPFRPPLSDFLETEKRRSADGQMGAVHTAQMVVNFLAKLAQETVIIGSGDHPPPIRRRGVTFENDNFVEEDKVNNNNVYSDTYFGGNLRRDELCVDAEMAGGHDLLQMVDYDSSKQLKEKKSAGLIDHVLNRRWTNETIRPVPLVAKTSDFLRAHHHKLKSTMVWSNRKLAGLALSVVMIFTLLLIPALHFEAKAVDKYVKDYRFASYYWGYLRPVFEAAESMISSVTYRPFLVRGPTPNPMDDLDPLTAMVLAIKDALVSVYQVFCDMFHHGPGAMV